MEMLCQICSENLVNSTEVYAAKCGHLFHHQCLVRWLARSQTCPQCRSLTTERSIRKVFLELTQQRGDPNEVFEVMQREVERLNLEVKVKTVDMNEVQNKYQRGKARFDKLRTDKMDLEQDLKFYKKKCAKLKADNVSLKRRVEFLEEHLTNVHQCGFNADGARKHCMCRIYFGG